MHNFHNDGDYGRDIKAFDGIGGEDSGALTGTGDVASPLTVAHTSSAHVVPHKLIVCKSTRGKAPRRQLVTEVDASAPGGCGDDSELVPPILALDDSGDGNEPVPPPVEGSLIDDIDASRLIAP
ncbi:hypothetical protein SLEP1_g7886 [Rubroshorea leprosula]|uniref:Uncharacterized protein n=1 Tax=Rubroshorea leprosula TaxID=152421 RepID=A0AAV5I5V4_9ROSI|nr:hypothetical protein SLEP1_g7886 [Rubroshorea leprosula]